MRFDRTPVDLLNVEKPFTDGGKPIGLTALDYWRFQFSNIWDAQEEVAEFIVAKALEMDLPFNKNGWTPYDIDYKGKRVEVKATSYFHSWRGDGAVSQQRVFSIAEAYGQHNESRETPERLNDVYVFCLNTGETKEDSDPFEMNHWEFYVIPTTVINRLCGKNKTISLGRVRTITNRPHGIDFAALKAAVDIAIGVSL